MKMSNDKVVMLFLSFGFGFGLGIFMSPIVDKALKNMENAMWLPLLVIIAILMSLYLLGSEWSNS